MSSVLPFGISGSARPVANAIWDQEKNQLARNTSWQRAIRDAGVRYNKAGGMEVDPTRKFGYLQQNIENADDQAEGNGWLVGGRVANQLAMPGQQRIETNLADQLGDNAIAYKNDDDNVRGAYANAYGQDAAYANRTKYQSDGSLQDYEKFNKELQKRYR